MPIDKDERPEVLVVAALMPWVMAQLREHYQVHDRTHFATDPASVAAFEEAAPRIRAIAANGEAKVPRALLDRLPAVEVVTVFGVGYDGVDVPAAHERGIPVTNTPDVLTDDVADLGIALLLAIARRVPQTELLELSACGHSPHRDQPATLIAAASRFMRQASANP